MKTQTHTHVFQDANTIKKIFAQKKAEMEHGEPMKSSMRIRYKADQTGSDVNQKNVHF